MERYILQDRSELERIQVLEDTCDNQDQITYFHDFTPEEMAEIHEDFAKVHLELQALEAEKKRLMEEMKAKMHPKQLQASLLLEYSKEGRKEIIEQCYQFNGEDGNAYFYNNKGENVYTRPLLARERQKTISAELRFGTHD